MNQLEFRMDVDSVRPLLECAKPLLESLNEGLASANHPPEEDELMVGLWSKDLLESQRKDVAAVAALFDERFLDTGRAIVDEENADFVVRGCAALRLKLRETALSELSDEALEAGELEIESFSPAQKIGYGAYLLFASVQELIISQMEL